jgi:3,4-dihydroxy 2-butanone 4-phosphate synthase/GTP cyclohydrolase II
MRILTNHPRKLIALEGYGLRVVEQVPLGDDAGEQDAAAGG